MKRALHIIGAVGGIGMVAQPAVETLATGVPPGKLQTSLQLVGVLLTLVASLSRILGKTAA